MLTVFGAIFQFRNKLPANLFVNSECFVGLGELMVGPPGQLGCSLDAASNLIIVTERERNTDSSLKREGSLTLFSCINFAKPFGIKRRPV